MARVARNLKELAKMIEGNIKTAMKTSVSDVALDTLNKHVVEDVYSAYTPQGKNPYQRTYQLLEDMEAKMIDENTLMVRSTREEDGRDIAEVIESGTGYMWEESKIYAMQPFPRPFHAEAKKELEEQGLARDALIKGLQKQGFKVKK